MTDIKTLLRSPDFLQLYQSGGQYQQEAVAFIASGKYTDTEKRIVVASLQRASLQEYTPFLKKVVSLFEANKLSDLIVQEAIWSPIDSNFLIINNYSHRSVALLLDKLRNATTANTTLHELVTEIATGQKQRDLSKPARRQ